MKTNKLYGAELDYWVARAEGLETPEINENVCSYVHHHEPGDDGWWREYKPSTDWLIGGPIIDRELIAIGHFNDGWRANPKNKSNDGFYSTNYESLEKHGPLLAAMRCYVFMTFGDDVPDYLRPA